MFLSSSLFAEIASQLSFLPIYTELINGIYFSWLLTGPSTVLYNTSSSVCSSLNLTACAVML